MIYVRNGACSGTTTPLLQRFDDPVGCAVVYVSGTYSRSLTIASANDIVIAPPAGSSNGDLRKDPNTDAVLGLRANNTVRVYHPVTRSNWSNPVACTDAAGTMNNVTIEAAILALTHSFVVDNDVYDDRLRYRSPPFFLDPVRAAWKVNRSNEQVPAAD